MQEENRVAEIEEIKETEGTEKMQPSYLDENHLSEEEKEKKKRRDWMFEMALFFILGLLIGITVKTEAVKRITIGFNDYQLKNGAQAFDIEKIKADLDQQAQQAQQAQENAQGSGGDIQLQPDSNQPQANQQPQDNQPSVDNQSSNNQ
jgi:hypothetical protein